MSRPGLRARVTAAFAVGALLLAALMALFSYDLTRRSLLDERERAAVRAAYYDAAVVRAGLDTGTPDVVEVLRSLDTGGARRAAAAPATRLVRPHRRPGRPARCRRSCNGWSPAGRPAVQRIRVDGQPDAARRGAAVGVEPGYYEINSLRELEQTFQVLALALTAVAVMIAGAGAALGWYATRTRTAAAHRGRRRRRADRGRRLHRPARPGHRPGPDPAVHLVQPRWSTSWPSGSTGTGASPPTSATSCAHRCRPSPRRPAC